MDALLYIFCQKSMNIFPPMENYEHNLGWRKFGWEDLAKVIGSTTHSLAKVQPRQDQECPRDEWRWRGRQTDRHTHREGCVEEVAFFYF